MYLYSLSVFASNFRSLRIEDSLSQRQLSELLSISVGVIKNLENKRQGITLPIFCQVVDFYSVSADWLLGLSDEKWLDAPCRYDMSLIGRKIAGLRASLGLVQSVYSGLIGTTPSCLGQIEIGRHGLSVSFLVRVSRLHSVSLDSLLGRK